MPIDGPCERGSHGPSILFHWVEMFTRGPRDSGYVRLTEARSMMLAPNSFHLAPLLIMQRKQSRLTEVLSYSLENRTPAI